MTETSQKSKTSHPNSDTENDTSNIQEFPIEKSKLNNSAVTAYVINLDSRKDRWAAIQTNFKDINSIQLVRFSAIVERPGFIGCAKSHLKLIQEAKERGDPFVMILEDDAIIKNPTTFEEQWDSILKWLKNHIDEWDVFNGGPGFWSGNAGVNKIIDVKRRIVDIRGGLCTHFVCYSSRAYDKLLTWTSSIGPIDVFIANKFTVLSAYPILSIQRPSYSNLWNHHTDYTGRYNYAEHIIKAALDRSK
jgi:GR25 family glycosyltransferase involved in LPS biosynthesis